MGQHYVRKVGPPKIRVVLRNLPMCYYSVGLPYDVVCMQLRRSKLYVLNGASCDCSGVERTTTDDGAVSSRGHLLVMGRRHDNRYVITHAIPFDRRSSELRRAMRTMRRRADAACGMQSRSRSRLSIIRDGFSS